MTTATEHQTGQANEARGTPAGSASPSQGTATTATTAGRSGPYVKQRLNRGEAYSKNAEHSTLGLREQQHRFALQQRAHTGAMALVAVLILAAIAVVAVLLSVYASTDRFDWHASLLVGALVVPATFISIGVLRAAFPRSKDDDLVEMPTTEALTKLKEILEMCGISSAKR